MQIIAIILYYYIYLIIYKGKTKANRREGQRLDGLPSFLPRTRPLPSHPSGDKSKAEQKSKKNGRKRENQGEGCRRPLRPFLASPSAPSDVFTVHIIASRSPPHPLATSPRVREGRPPRPLLGDVIATPRHHLASNQRPQGSVSTFCHHARLVLFLFLFLPLIQVVKAGQSKRASRREGRERARAKDAAAISPVPLFCLLPSPSTPSPVLPFRLRLRFLLFFALISSARSHLFALPSSCSSFLVLLPSD